MPQNVTPIAAYFRLTSGLPFALWRRPGYQNGSARMIVGEKHRKFARLAVLGASERKLAKALGVSQAQAHRWLKSPEMAILLDDARAEIRRQCLGQVKRQAPKAIRKLADLQDCPDRPDIQVRAASKLADLGVGNDRAGGDGSAEAVDERTAHEYWLATLASLDRLRQRGAEHSATDGNAQDGTA